MKQLLAIVLMFVGVMGYGQSLQKKDVPDAVVQSFTKQFPQIKDANWSKENNQYEVNFEQNDNAMSATYDAQGNHIETETELNTNQLPQPVQSTIASQFSDYKLKEAAKIVNDNGTSYEAELHKGEKSFDVIFNADGKVLKNANKNNEDKESAEENDESMEEDED